MSSALFSVSTRPAALTAVTRVDRAGLLLAGVATGSCDMPSNEPLPEVGTAEQPAPNGALASAAEDEGDIEGSMAGLDMALEDGAAAEAGAELPEVVPPQAARLSGKATTAVSAAIFLRFEVSIEVGPSWSRVREPHC